MAFGFPAYHTDVYSCSVRQDRLHSIVLEAIAALGWRIHDDLDDTVIALVRVNVWSWGEYVTIRMRTGELYIKSACRLLTQCIDWGKNEENVSALIAELRKVSACSVLAEPLEQTEHHGAQAESAQGIQERTDRIM